MSYCWIFPVMVAAMAWAATCIRRQLRNESRAEAARWKALMGPLSAIPAESWRLRHEWRLMRKDVR